MLTNEKYHWKCMVEGDKNAFLSIYQQYYFHLFKYAFSITLDRELAKDSIQELFLEIWNTRTTLNKDVQNIRSYLITWLRRKICRTLSGILKEKHAAKRNELNDFNQPSYEELLIAFQGTEEKKARLSKALKSLTKKQIQIIRLRFFDNLSYDEIAAKTSLTTRTVYNTIYQAIQHLREDVSLLV